MTPVWTHTNPLPDGHVLFFTDSKQFPDLIAIADESGDKPENTDDGVLWLDFERPLMMGDDTCLIPVKDPDSNEKMAGGTNVSTIILLANWFNWQVNVRGILHRIQRSNDTAKVVPLALVLEELESHNMLRAATIVGERFG